VRLNCKIWNVKLAVKSDKAIRTTTMHLDFNGKKKVRLFFGLVIALRPQTPKHIRGGWSHYTDTSEEG
jgi:hypothetical protein